MTAESIDDYKRWNENLRAKNEQLGSYLSAIAAMRDGWEARGNEETWFSVPASHLNVVLAAWKNSGY